MKQVKKSLPLWNTHTHTHIHTHRKIEKREKVRAKARGGNGMAACPGPVEGIGLGPWWRQMQSHSSGM